MPYRHMFLSAEWAGNKVELSTQTDRYIRKSPKPRRQFYCAKVSTPEQGTVTTRREGRTISPHREADVQFIYYKIVNITFGEGAHAVEVSPDSESYIDMYAPAEQRHEPLRFRWSEGSLEIRKELQGDRDTLTAVWQKRKEAPKTFRNETRSSASEPRAIKSARIQLANRGAVFVLETGGPDYIITERGIIVPGPSAEESAGH